MISGSRYEAHKTEISWKEFMQPRRQICTLRQVAFQKKGAQRIQEQREDTSMASPSICTQRGVAYPKRTPNALTLRGIFAISRPGDFFSFDCHFGQEKSSKKKAQKSAMGLKINFGEQFAKKLRRELATKNGERFFRISKKSKHVIVTGVTGPT